MPDTIAILGSGAWSTALAVVLANQHPRMAIRMWSHQAEQAVQLNTTRENTYLLPGVRIPDAVTILHDPAAVVHDALIWVVGIPTAFLADSLQNFAQYTCSGLHVVSLTKGIENRTFRRPSEIIRDILGRCAVTVLSGPSHAEEVARGLPTSIVAANESAAHAVEIQHLFTTERLRIYTNTDRIGVELAGALKNVIGIAAGICDGLGFGDNAKAAMLTRGLVEMIRFGVAHGAEPSTFHGLAGMGDLITTCFSPHGRNRRVGERLARGESLAAILSSPQVAEGVNTARSVAERAKQMGIDVPIMTAVQTVLSGEESPQAVVQKLMARETKSEIEG